MKAILFDFGGTIDTNGVHWSEMFREHHRRLGLRPDGPAFDRAFVESERRIAAEPGVAALGFRALLERQFRLQFEILGAEGAERMARRAAEECGAEVGGIVARAAALLRAFRERYRLGLVSNFYGNLEPVCRELGIDALFETLTDSAVEGVRKPDPALFARALERLGVPAAEAWVVGDSYDRDIEPAKALGCRTIWLKGRSWTVPASTVAADYTITSLEAMKAIVLP